MQWTHDQQKAINLRNTDILVTAAAGSGKTAVLVERIISLLHEGADISRMLIVTFTRAAAASMREKLSSRLYEIAADDDLLLRQAEKVENASICTIDSFCADFLRTHFAVAGVDPSFRIIEETERRRLLENSARTALAQAYADSSEDFLRFSRWREPSDILADILQVISFREAQPDPDAWQACQPLSIHMHQLRLAALDDVHETLSAARSTLTLCVGTASPCEKIIAEDICLLDDLLSLPESALSDALSSFSWPRWSLPRGLSGDTLVSSIKDRRDHYKKYIDHAKKTFVFPLDQSIADHEENARQLSALMQIVRHAESLLADALDEDNALGFPDMARRTLRTLNDPQISALAREHFKDAVFVDEYQDVSALQDALIQQLSTPGRLFLVGDVKQSIYRFRLAEPTLFLNRHKAYGNHEGGERIALSANFRSRAPILHYTNLVFSRAMNRPRSEIIYDDEAALRVGRQSDDADPPVEVFLLSSRAGNDEDDPLAELEEIERESSLAADRIQALMAENPGLHYRDFAILSRVAGSVFPRVSDLLALRGIPSECETASSFYDAMEIRVALALLRLTENRRRDTDWIAALRLGASALSLNDLAHIRLCAPDMDYADAVMSYAQIEDDIGRRIRIMAEKLDRWRELAGSLPAQQLVYTVIRESGLLAHAASLSGAAGRINRLTALCDAAASFDALRHTGLSGYLSDLEDSLRHETQKLRSAPESDDAVHLMTIHASKGLEYPVVIGLRLGRQLKHAREDCEIRLHPRLGAGIRCIDPELGASRDTLSLASVRSALSDESMEEELRLLYVLLTRARDRLILIGSVKDTATALQRYEEQAASSPRPSTLLDSLIPPILAHRPDYVTLLVDPPISAAISQIQTDNIPPQPDSAFRAAYQWRYPHEDASMTPVKMTVTALKQELSGPACVPALEERPAFMTQASPTGAEKGTSVHQALHAMNLDRLRGLSGISLRAQIREQLEDAIQRGLMMLPPDPNLIAHFFESPLGQRVLSASEVRREWAFNLVTSPKQVGLSDSTERMLLQGAIDLCFRENNAWVLVDYKTDWDESVLLQRYSPQLRLYARALWEITGIPVKEIWLCALKSGRQILLP